MNTTITISNAIIDAQSVTQIAERLADAHTKNGADGSNLTKQAPVQCRLTDQTRIVFRTHPAQLRNKRKQNGSRYSYS